MIPAAVGAGPDQPLSLQFVITSLPRTLRLPINS